MLREGLQDGPSDKPNPTDHRDADCEQVGSVRDKALHVLFGHRIAAGALKPATVVLRDQCANRISDGTAKHKDNSQEDQ
jgi:hypothetical protein